jgi:heat shock protein HtpX
MPHWSFTFLGILQFYFTTNYVAAVISVAVLALLASFGVFALSESHGTKSDSLLSAMVISTSLWIFILSSVALCAGLMGEYNSSPVGAVLDIARFALLPTVLLGPLVFYLLRNRAMKQVYPYFTFTSKSEIEAASSDTIRSRTSSIFSTLTRAANLSGISLSIVPGMNNLPASAALDWNGEKVVAVSSSSAAALDDDELKAVLAHELGHIAHKDSLRKTLATAYRTAFIFDPIAHFVEAAIYRDGEFYADEYSANLTGKPAALASALIKIHESMRTPMPKIPVTQGASMLLEDHESSLLSKQPSLTLRIKKLLEMEGSEDKAKNLKPEDKAIA